MARIIMIRSDNALAEATRATATTLSHSQHDLTFVGSHNSTAVAPRLNQAITLKYAERKLVFDEKQNADAIYQLVYGAVLISCTTQDCERQAIEIVKPHGYFGITSGAEYDCRAETLTRCMVRRIDRSLADGSPHTQRLLAEQLICKVADYRGLLGRRSATERVSSLLLALPASAEPRGRGAEERIALTQAEMASLLGLAIETVCRVLGDLKRNGAISSACRGRITIVDPVLLSTLAGS